MPCRFESGHPHHYREDAMTEEERAELIRKKENHLQVAEAQLRMWTQRKHKARIQNYSILIDCLRREISELHSGG